MFQLCFQRNRNFHTHTHIQGLPETNCLPRIPEIMKSYLICNTNGDVCDKFLEIILYILPISAFQANIRFLFTANLIQVSIKCFRA